MFLFDLISEWISGILLMAGYVTGSAAFPKPLSPEEEKRYLSLYKEGDKDAKNTLIEHNLRLVAHIAKKYSDDKNQEDLISIGTIGLIKGINTFDPDKNSRLSTYIARCIENEVLMYLRTSKKLNNEISMDESIGTDKEGNNMTFSDILMMDQVDFADSISSKMEAQKLYDAMRTVLKPSEIEILCWRYGLGNTKKKTQKEIAEIMGISRSYVSRIEKKCLKKLSAILDTDSFME